jgi:hypothetical protein
LLGGEQQTAKSIMSEVVRLVDDTDTDHHNHHGNGNGNDKTQSLRGGTTTTDDGGGGATHITILTPTQRASSSSNTATSSSVQHMGTSSTTSSTTSTSSSSTASTHSVGVTIHDDRNAMISSLSAAGDRLYRNWQVCITTLIRCCVAYMCNDSTHVLMSDRYGQVRTVPYVVVDG